MLIVKCSLLYVLYYLMDLETIYCSKMNRYENNDDVIDVIPDALEDLILKSYHNYGNKAKAIENKTIGTQNSFSNDELQFLLDSKNSIRRSHNASSSAHVDDDNLGIAIKEAFRNQDNTNSLRFVPPESNSVLLETIKKINRHKPRLFLYPRDQFRRNPIAEKLRIEILKRKLRHQLRSLSMKSPSSIENYPENNQDNFLDRYLDLQRIPSYGYYNDLESDPKSDENVLKRYLELAKQQRPQHTLRKNKKSLTKKIYRTEDENDFPIDPSFNEDKIDPIVIEPNEKEVEHKPELSNESDEKSLLKFLNTQLLHELLQEKLDTVPNFSKHLLSSVLDELATPDPNSSKKNSRDHSSKHKKKMQKANKLKKEKTKLDFALDITTEDVTVPEANEKSSVTITQAEEASTASSEKSISEKENAKIEADRKYEESLKLYDSNKRDYNKLSLKNQEIILFITINAIIFISVSLMTVFIVMRCHRTKPLINSDTQTSMNLLYRPEEEEDAFDVFSKDKLLQGNMYPQKEPCDKCDSFYTQKTLCQKILTLTPKIDYNTNDNHHFGKNKSLRDSYQPLHSSCTDCSPNTRKEAKRTGSGHRKSPNKHKHHRHHRKHHNQEDSYEQESPCPSLSVVVSSALKNENLTKVPKWVKAKKSLDSQNNLKVF